MNSYFRTILENNLHRQRELLTAEPWHGLNVTPWKQLWFCSADVTGIDSSWMEDYKLTAYGWLAAMGFDCSDIIRKLGRFVVGRYNNWPPEDAAPYQMAMAGAPGMSDEWLFDGSPLMWKRAYRETYLNRAGQDWSWRGTRGYAAYARAALAAMIDACRPNPTPLELLADSIDALARCNAALGAVPWERDAYWNIVPR